MVSGQQGPQPRPVCSARGWFPRLGRLVRYLARARADYSAAEAAEPTSLALEQLDSQLRVRVAR